MKTHRGAGGNAFLKDWCFLFYSIFVCCLTKDVTALFQTEFSFQLAFGFSCAFPEHSAIFLS